MKLYCVSSVVSGSKCYFKSVEDAHKKLLEDWSGVAEKASIVQLDGKNFAVRVEDWFGVVRTIQDYPYVVVEVVLEGKCCF